jgi:hypothetical protein
MSELKTFRVDFFDTYRMRIRLKAHSAADAIKKAENIYLDNPGDHRISMWSHDPFAKAEAKRVMTFADIACALRAGGEP